CFRFCDLSELEAVRHQIISEQPVIRPQSAERLQSGLSMFGLFDYRGLPRRRLHSPRAERMKVKPPSPPSAQSVQTKKKPPVDLAISLECSPLMCMTGMAAANNPTSSMMTYPERRSLSTSVPYSNTTRTANAMFEGSAFDIPRTMSSVM